ncbi:MAG: PAS domain S-box protein [Reyranella sp.]|nr:PAS domain S-box protein [Reyranella sp.]
MTDGRTPPSGTTSIRTRVIAVLVAYALLTAAALVVLVLYLRADAIASGQKVLAGFAELANDQTAGTLKAIERTLRDAESRLSAATIAGTIDVERVRPKFEELLEDRPFLTSIQVVDSRGRFALGRSTADTGRDVSDRAFFIRQREQPGSALLWGIPVKARSNGEWLATATLPILQANGDFGGLIVGTIPLAYFDNIWKGNNEVEGLTISLWRDDGILLMRSPFDERVIGSSAGDGALFAEVRAGRAKGRFETVRLVDDMDSIVVFRRLDAYPAFILSVTQTIDQTLAAWWHAVWVVAAGWAVAAAMVGGLAIRVTREWNARLAVEDRHRILFDANPSPMLVVDRDTGRILAANDVAVDQYGWSRDELLAMTSDEIYAPADVPIVTALRRQIVPGTVQLLPELRHHKKDGAVITVETNVRLIDFEGRAAFLSMVRDVTARKAAEQHLTQMESQYRGLLEAAPDAMVVVNRAGEIVLLNVQVEKQFGYRRDELLGQRVTNIIPEGFAERLVTDATRSETDALAQEIGTGIELSGRRKDGTEFPIEIMLSPLTSAEGVLLVTAAIRNISLRKAAEEQLRQSQKMEAVGQLTGGIAHDFNNILFVILANTDALLEEENFSPSVADRLGQIDKAVQRASDLTRQLLAFSRKQPLRPQMTDLNDLVTDTGKLLRRSLGAQIKIDAVLADDLCVVNVDRSQFETALVNLCINARDAMPGGGRLLLETRTVTLDEEYCIFHEGAAPGTYAMLSVTDAGIGIPVASLNKVFEPFFTTKEAGKGTGLGLSMVYGFIKQSNGHVSIDSKLGHGTSVKLLLPCSDGVVMEPVIEDKTPVPGGTERILVVEDEPQVRANVVRQLRSLGYSVSEAPDGAAGVAAFEEASASYDLLLSDVVMPGPTSGKLLAAEVTRRWPATKIVFMSGFTETSTMRHGRLDEDALLLSKPFRKADLARMIRRTLDATDRSSDVAALPT